MNTESQMNQKENSQFAQYNQSVQQNPFGAQVMMQKQLKKPKKLGWIISLSILIVSIITIVSGMLISGNGINELNKHIDNDSNVYERSLINSETYLYSGLTPGKEYFVALSQESGTQITSVEVDNNSVSAFFEQARETNSNTKSFKVYRFVAKSDEAVVKVTPITKQTKAGLTVIDAEKSKGAVNQAVMGLFIFVIGVIIAVISFILFIVFFVIFLVKNSKYKKAQRYTSMM